MGAVAALADAQRRALYGFVCRQRQPVTREEAAAAVGISRKLAAFHLDKLIAAGLLRRGRPRPDQRPRRRGRAPKLYEPSGVEVQVTIPDRRYELAAEILLDAVGADAAAVPLVLRAARDRGAHLGREAREATRPGRLSAERALTLLEPLLTAGGYLPVRVRPDAVQLDNCPFHKLAEQDRQLVCSMNQAYLAGVIEGLEAPAVRAELSPRPGCCCVELRANGSPPTADGTAT